MERSAETALFLDPIQDRLAGLLGRAVFGIKSLLCQQSVGGMAHKMLVQCQELRVTLPYFVDQHLRKTLINHLHRTIEIWRREDLDDIFIGLEGRAQISGKNLEVTFSGANIGLNATGDAEMVLQGYGIYIYGMDIGRWLPEGKTLFLQD